MNEIDCISRMKKYSNLNVCDKDYSPNLLRIIFNALKSDRFTIRLLTRNLYHLDVSRLMYPYDLVYVLGRYKNK